jgi:uncharacterized membrane protein YkoI
MSRTTVLLALILILGAGCTQAEPPRPLPPSANVSLLDAIKSAQQHSQGRAIRAEYEQQKDGKWVYDVEVANGATLTEVKIDANDGAIVGTRDAKQRDDEKDGDRDDDND